MTGVREYSVKFNIRVLPMKYTILGINQERAIALGLDLPEMLILEWFSQFRGTGKMKHQEHNGDIYYWINYNTVLEELPILRTTSKKIKERYFDRLCKAGVLKHTNIPGKGRVPYYAVGENFEGLYSSPPETGNSIPQKEGMLSPETGNSIPQKEGNINLRTNNPLTNTLSFCPESSNADADEKTEFEKIALESAEYMADKISEHTPNFPQLRNGSRKQTVIRWAKDVEKLLRIDKVDFAEFKKVLTFAMSDDFWRRNILSGAKLRKQYGQLLVKIPPDVKLESRVVKKFVETGVNEDGLPTGYWEEMQC